MYLIGVDIGGTNLKIGLVEDAKIIDKLVVPTDKEDVCNQMIATIYQLLENNNLAKEDLACIGIACPGIIKDGTIRESANLKLTGCNMQGIIADEFGVKVYVKNDADMATLAEHELGGGKGFENMVMITIGTGIGGGIIIDNKLYEGNGGAGELGHILFKKDGIKCNCGRLGCVEKYISAIALSNRAKEMMREMPTKIPSADIINASVLQEYYLKGDKCAITILDEYISDLADYVLNLCNIFRPEAILIGGGITYAPMIIEKVGSLCKKHNFGYPNSVPVLITSAKLGNDAGILGVVSVNKN